MANEPDIVQTTPMKPRVRKTRRFYRLAPRDIRFATLTLEYRSATKAYLEVIARDPDLDPDTAAVCASRMMRREDIREFIRDLINDAAIVAGVSATKVIARATEIAFADWTLIYDTKGRIKPFDQWPPGYRELVSIEHRVKGGYKKVRGKRKRVVLDEEIKVKTPKQSEGLDLLARYFKLVGTAAVDPNADKFKPMVIGGEADIENI